MDHDTIQIPILLNLQKGFNFDEFLESSILIAMTFTLVSSCHSSYISVIASSSLIQFLHHNAQKLITIGLPSFSKEDVLTVFPSKVLMLTEGIF